LISISTNVLGVFALKNAKIIKYERFPEDASEVSKILAETRDGVSQLEEKILRGLSASGTKVFAVDNPNRFYGLALEASFTQDENPTDVYTIAAELGVDRKRLQELIYAVNLESTKAQISTPERDQLVIQAVNSLDELSEEINITSERLREWYSLHFPELNHIVLKHEVYARLIADAGERAKVGGVRCGLDEKFMKKITEASKTSFGFDFTPKDAEIVQTLASSLLTLAETKGKIEAYVKEIMKEIAPNLSHLIEPEIAARLIAKAGSLERLAKMPAGTIQILGAEDAFFRFLKTGKKPPKHGIIFNHPAIRSSPKKVRGKIARTLSAKLAIAAKADAFHGDFIGEELKRKLDERLKTLTKNA
jgi:nucleolar protein 56